MNKEYLTYDMKKTVFAILIATLFVGCYEPNDVPKPVETIIEDYTGNTPPGSCEKETIRLPKGFRFSGFSKEGGSPIIIAMTEMDSGYVPKKSIIYQRYNDTEHTYVKEIIESW